MTGSGQGEKALASCVGSDFRWNPQWIHCLEGRL